MSYLFSKYEVMSLAHCCRLKRRREKQPFEGCFEENKFVGEATVIMDLVRALTSDSSWWLAMPLKARLIQCPCQIAGAVGDVKFESGT